MKQFLGAMALLGLIFGVILFMIGWQENTLLSQGSPTPQTITLSELEDKGPGNNINVTVTNFDFGMKYVYVEKNKVWQEVWIPIIGIGRNENRPAKVVVRTSKPKNPTELEQYCNNTKTLNGLITNSIRSLGNKEKDILKKDYPTTDWDKVLVLEEGRAFPSSGYVYGMMGGGAALVLLGIGFGIGWILVKQ